MKAKVKRKPSFLFDNLVHRQNGDLKEINKLARQLSPDAEPLELAEFYGLLNSNNRLLVCRTKNKRKIVAMALLIPCKKITAKFGLIEDVVVDKKHRGRDIATKMMKILIAKAVSLDLKYVQLTSAPHRVAANKLYRKLGFERRETNVYRLPLDRP